MQPIRTIPCNLYVRLYAVYLVYTYESMQPIHMSPGTLHVRVHAHTYESMLFIHCGLCTSRCSLYLEVTVVYDVGVRSVYTQRWQESTDIVRAACTCESMQVCVY